MPLKYIDACPHLFKLIVMQVMLKWNDYLYYYERIICKFKHTLRAAVLIFSVFSLCHLHRAHSRCCWLTIAEFPFHQGEITCSKSWLKASRTHRKRNKQLDVCVRAFSAFICLFVCVRCALAFETTPRLPCNVFD